MVWVWRGAWTRRALRCLGPVSKTKVMLKILFCLVLLGVPAVHAADVPRVELPEGRFVVIGDQLIDADLFDASQRAHVLGERPANVRLWPDGVIGIRFGNDVSPALQKTVWAACAEWSAAAHVRCVKGAYKGRVLTIARSFMGFGNGCWSMLGSEAYFMGLRRRMNLGKGCDHYATVLHELGHAFGLTHEHQRMDRDKYVTILTQNVDGQFLGFGTKLNFGLQKGQLLTPYDFLSIMHYDRKAFSKNGKETIRPKADFARFADVMGHGQHLSDGDIMSIQTLYGKPAPTKSGQP